MPALLTETQNELIQIATSLTTNGLKNQRAILDGEPATSEPTATLMRDFSLIGLPESIGGEGGSLVDLIVFVEGLSRTVEPGPFVHHVAALQSAFGAGLEIGSLIEGGHVAVVGLFEKPGQRWGEWTDLVVEGKIRARKIGVPFAMLHGPAVVVGSNNSIGIGTVRSVSHRLGIDPSLDQGDIEVEGLSVNVKHATKDASLRGALLIAASAIGTARGALNSASSYAAIRKQFGQFIGSFQGIAHMLADAFVDIEAAWSLLLYAGWCVENASPDSAAAAHGAIAKAGSTAIQVAERALQVHGGIGVTWEADSHLYIRRILALNSLTGSAVSHYRALGAHLTIASMGAVC